MFKTHLFLKFVFALFGLFIAFAIGDGEPPHANPSKPPPTSTKAVVRMDEASDIRSLGVWYGHLGGHPGAYVAGYVDNVKKIFYEWGDLKLEEAQMPHWGVMQMPSEFELQGSGLKIIKCNPPIRLVKIGDSEAGIAYYDGQNGMLYRWKGIRVDIKSVPTALLVDAKKFDLVDVSPPAASVK